MSALVECVPNFSEGRDMSVIDKITAEIKAVSGVSLLDVDPGKETNRTVVTFVGDPDAVVEAAFRAIAKAAQLIDMRKHKGAHARMGATDVCPFVPVSGITIEECVELARRLGKRVGDELGIPVYLYEYAATKPERKNLAFIREGEYEGFFEKIKQPGWEPDFGPREFNAKAGGTVIGVREFLIAYNINLNTRNKKHASQIALNIREKGRAKRDENGKIVRDEHGNKIMVPGKFKELKATGWYIPEYQCAQISMNLTNYKVTPVHAVFDEVCRQAEERGVRVTGSELVGLVPKAAMVEAGRHYLRKAGDSAGVPERELIRIAVQSMGLSELTPFDPDEKIIEYRVKKPTPLVDMKGKEFVDELSTDSPAPGGGSVSAMGGAYAAALLAMVCNLTVNKKGYEDVWEEMKDTAEKAQALKDELLAVVDEDTEAFNRVMDCFAMPKKTDEQKRARKAAVEKATQEATLVPLKALKIAEKVIALAESVVKKGNKNSLSDAGVAVSFARACARGAYLNVRINLNSLEDMDFIDKTASEADECLSKVESKAKELEELVVRMLDKTE